MKIYIAHSRSFDFQKELYAPIQSSALIEEHAFIFPHIKNGEPFNSKEFFQNGCDLVIAEVSYPATGVGIELGWADMLRIPVICVYKIGVKTSDSLKVITSVFLEYSNTDELVSKLEQAIKNQL